ncbi:MAG: efflux RND transporter permease subunit [Muribaculaceae bacterium]|nr:efflux RND transporter permease subunit [Muribaculaceae bacterium]
MFSKFFIDRPIFATVLAILMVLVGLLMVKELPIAQFPDITPPTVMVSASYPGADAKTISEVIGVPIEEQVNGVENMLYMSSSSSDGSYQLTITFENGTDLDMATVKVQNRVAQATPSLPSIVQQQGVNVMSRSSENILFIAIESDSTYNYDGLFLTNYAKLNIVDELARVDGVGSVNAFGAGTYSMRVWLDPEKMRARDLTPADVVAMISAQNMEVSAGNVGAPPQQNKEDFQYTLTVQGRLTDAEQFGDIILRTNDDGGVLHLSDIARVDLGSQSYSAVSHVDGREAGLLGIAQLPGANALDVAHRVEARLDQLQQYFPPGVHYRIIEDSTKFVTASIDEVLVTFVETTLIVMVVILLFLQSWRAVVIPMITIPVSLIATFAVMKLMGFTLNTLTLFGLVLAIAIVVDDAIVVVEDCARLVQEGKLTPRQSAEQAMVELQGPVIGEVLVLLSVFIPTAFVSGITGELYKQFALTIAVSTAFSGFNALTFTPAMCALFLRKKEPSNNFVWRWFNKGFGATVNFYMKIVGTFLRRPVVAIGVYLAICFAAFYGFIKWPTTYVPSEDMGYFMTTVQLPTGASLQRTEAVLSEIAGRVKTLPEVKNVMSVSGVSFMGGGATSNVGSLIVALKPWNDRKSKSEHVNAVIDKVTAMTADIQEAVIFSLNPPAIPGLGMTSGLQMQLLDINNLGASQLATAVKQIQEAAARDPRLKSVTTMYQGEVPQYHIDINREKVKMEGISLSDVYSTLSAFMGGQYVNDFVKFGRVYQVNIAGDSRSRSDIEDIQRLSVRNSSGEMVPFSSFMTVTEVMGEPSVERYNMYTTASITGTPADNVSTSDAIKAMEDIVNNTLGNTYSYSWTGEAYQETQASTTVSMVMIFAVIVTILVLAAQYESWTDPIAVVISMPTAILGTVLGCIIMSQAISIYTQIGIILLLGLSAKNAILIVEYARDFRNQGQDIRQAALDAGRIRFRPVMMTALAFVFGVMPMLFATGAGAASRVSLGTAVVFGMFINAVVGTLFVPNFWELLERFREKYLAKLFADSDTPTKDASTGGDAQQGTF